MASTQATETTAQNQPLNNAENDAGNDAAAAEKSRKARITKIKQKVLPGFRITLLLSLLIYLAMLIIGILGVHKCPVEENIPLFLIATGAIGLITKILTYAREIILRHVQIKYVESSLYTVEIAFLILGAYWVYKEYPPSYDASNQRYCQKTAYLFAFVYLTILLGIGLCVLLGFGCFLLCICFLVRTEGQDVEAQQPKAGNKDNDPVGV